MELINFYIQVWVAVCQFMFFECQNCPGIITDPKWNQQWYLHTPRHDKHDLNVMPAWRMCINGSGITVGVVDLGVDDHYDLHVDRHISVRYQLPRIPERRFYNNYNNEIDIKKVLRHGTRVAGIIAGKKNDIGIIGIAFEATIADIRVGSSTVFETLNIEYLHHHSNIIDVYSCSFSNFHTGAKTYPLKPDQQRAFTLGTSQGRNGLGSVYVFASGNSGGTEDNLFRDSCAYDRLITNRFVITVAGVQHNLEKLPSGEECSAMLIAAFTAKPGSRDHRIWTTDIHNDYTPFFDQSSAAAPMVSGAVALALQANPRLTYRDVMHLLVNTAKSDIFDQRYFKANAANLKVSSTFGFGLLDIGVLVEKSKNWTTVPAKQTCNKLTQFNTPTNLNNFVIKVDRCNANYIEHVEVSLKVDHPNAGQIRWVLISPYGTKSIILPGRGLDSTKNMDLTVLTVQMWGENPNGYWRLEASPVFGATLDKNPTGMKMSTQDYPLYFNDRRGNVHTTWQDTAAPKTSLYTGNGQLKSAKLTIHGYRCGNNVNCLRAAQQDEVSWRNWSTWTQCNCENRLVSRQRLCNRLKESDYCIGNSIDKQHCVPQNCQTTIVELQWSAWSEWTDCPASCEHEDRIKFRSRTCSQQGRCRGNDIQTRPCPRCSIPPNRPIELQWSAWSEWTNCPASCEHEDRLQIRSRTCSQQGRCRGNGIQTRPCPRCSIPPNRPIELQWSAWSEWTNCPASCEHEDRLQIRSRTCSQQGRCRGNGIQTRPCPRCSIPPNRPINSQWSIWSQWSPCSESCGYGSKERTRQCSGRYCPGESNERRTCFERICPTDCTDTRRDCPGLVSLYGCTYGLWNYNNCQKSCNRC